MPPCNNRGKRPELTPARVHDLVGRNNATILEIGANDGSDSVLFATNFPIGRICCFECDQRAISKWRKRLGSPSHVQLIECALCDRNGTSLFYPSGGLTPQPHVYGYEDWDKSGSLCPPDRHTQYDPWLRFLPPVEVRTMTLDSWVAENHLGVIDFAWVDVQGAEAMVLRGAQATLPRIRWWYCECHSLPLYHGQATLEEVQSLLPGFVLHSQHCADNFLFRNAQL